MNEGWRPTHVEYKVNSNMSLERTTLLIERDGGLYDNKSPNPLYTLMQVDSKEIFIPVPEKGRDTVGSFFGILPVSKEIVTLQDVEIWFTFENGDMLTLTKES